MNLPQIKLQTTQARIDIKTSSATLEIVQPPADLSIQQPKAEMTIDRKAPILTIDQTMAREDMDLKHVSKRIEDAAKRGYDDWLSGLLRVAQDGDELMRIENGGSPIAEQAKRNSESPQYEYNIGWIPTAGSVNINYDPGSLNISWNTKKPIIESSLNKPHIRYTPGKTEVHLSQQQSLKIDFENLIYKGINYEQKI